MDISNENVVDSLLKKFKDFLLKENNGEKFKFNDADPDYGEKPKQDLKSEVVDMIVKEPEEKQLSLYEMQDKELREQKIGIENERKHLESQQEAFKAAVKEAKSRWQI